VTAWKAVLDIIEVLGLNAANAMSAKYIGLRMPQSADELPGVVVSIQEAEETPIGIGGVVEAHKVSEVQWDTTDGLRTSGLLAMEIWAADEQALMKETTALFQTLQVSAGEMSQRGFIKWSVREIQMLENVIVDGQPIQRVGIVCSTIHEDQKTDSVGPGGIIDVVQVESSDLKDSKDKTQEGYQEGFVVRKEAN
jgi:hypothetical protein